VTPNPNNAPRIVIVGVGGGGLNTLDRLAKVGPRNVELVAVDTDTEALERCQAGRHLQIGREATRGLGCGGRSEAGARAAEESRVSLREACADAALTIVIAGLGGGTGGGAAPLVTKIASGCGALAIGIAATPFNFEGGRRVRDADLARQTLQANADAVIELSNEDLLQLIDRRASVRDAFGMVADRLCWTVRSLVGPLTVPGLIAFSLDDLRSLLRGAGWTAVGIGSAEGPDRVSQATGQALFQVPMREASGVLLSVQAGPNLTERDLNDATALLLRTGPLVSRIVRGTTVGPTVSSTVTVTLIAVGP
jgi:cell division protein FtsZ